MMPMSLATAAKENCAWPPALLMPDPFPLPGGGFQCQTWLGEHRLGPALLQCTETSCVVGSIGAGDGSPRLAGADHDSGTAIHSLSWMILYFYLEVCGIFFKLSSNQERTMKDFVLVKGIIVTSKAAISWHPSLPQTALLPKLCPSVDYVTSEMSVLKLQCVHICPSPACSVFKAFETQ